MQKKRIVKLRPVAKNCNFCKSNKDPNYKNVSELSQFITERGKILGKDRTGICSKHQRLVGAEIKRARFIGLLPFVVRA